jgi:putative hydrolase
MSDPGQSGNPLQSLLGDLLKVVGASSGGVAPWWEAARSLAYGVATDSAPEQNIDPLERIRLSELARVAELHVAEVTGLTAASTDALELTPVSRGQWALRALEAWRPYLEAMVAAQPGTTSGAPPGALPPGLGLGDAEDGGLEGLTELLGQFATTIGPVLVGLQFGSTAGHLAQRALGQYAVPIPWPPSNELLVVPQNVETFARDWSLPEDETRLWVCIRERTAHSILSLPHVAARFAELLSEATAEAVNVQHELGQRLSGEMGDQESLQNLLSDPESMLADLLTPSARPGSAQLTALATALGAYVDHVTTKVAQGLAGSAPALSEAWYRYRIADARGERAAAALFGIDVGRAEVDRGSAFVRGVIERAGEEGLGRLWSSARTLPTSAELDAPGLWLARISLPLPEGTAGEADADTGSADTATGSADTATGSAEGTSEGGTRDGGDDVGGGPGEAGHP